MLGQRVVTAVLMLAVLLPALFAGTPWPFQGLALLLVAAASWEWARLNSAPGTAALLCGAALAAACAAVLVTQWTAPVALWWAVALAWVVGGGLALRVGPGGWLRLGAAWRWIIGLALLWTAWLAIGQARVVGINFVLSLFALVWVADIAAYFAGRAFGRRKLAPTISPGKTWEGVFGGLLGVGALAWAWSAADAAWPSDSASLYTQLLQRWGPAGAALALAALTSLSVMGDLFESLVKRAAGAKDSSRLLPGHGGVLDRIDALLPVCPVALAMLAT